jgi:FtsH-binding integral membrane protein
MGHNPVNHPLRPIYRALGAFVGLYFVVFGVIGLITTADESFFATDIGRVFSQGTNLANSILSIILGGVVLLGAVIGRNLDVAIDKYLGWGLLVLGTYELAAMRTDANFLNFTISTVVVVYLAGLVLIMASYYSKVAPREETGAPRQVQQRQAA